jgi:hypothetical protein
MIHVTATATHERVSRKKSFDQEMYRKDIA